MQRRPKVPSKECLDRVTRTYEILPEEGLVINRVTRKFVGYVGSQGYYMVRIYGFREIRRAHLIWWAYHGTWPDEEIDHGDRNKTNDRISNLARSDPSYQAMNSDRVQRAQRKNHL